MAQRLGCRIRQLQPQFRGFRSDLNHEELDTVRARAQAGRVAPTLPKVLTVGSRDNFRNPWEVERVLKPPVQNGAISDGVVKLTAVLRASAGFIGARAARASTISLPAGTSRMSYSPVLLRGAWRGKC